MAANGLQCYSCRGRFGTPCHKLLLPSEELSELECAAGESCVVEMATHHTGSGTISR